MAFLTSEEIADIKAKGGLDGNDYVLPKELWGTSQEYRHNTGIHLRDGGYNPDGTPFGKLPNHPTFSNGSPFSDETTQGGEWKRINNSWTFTPSDFMLKDKNRIERLKQYWQQFEKDATLNLNK